MTSPCSSASTTVRLSVSVPFVCSVALIWTYGFHVMRGFEGGLRELVLSGFLVGIWALYREWRVRLELSALDLRVLCGLLVMNLLIHPGLFSALGGDELYHAELSALVLMKVRSYVLSLPVTHLDDIRGSMWQLFDLQHMPVVDIWQILAPVILAVCVLLALGWRGIRRGPPALRWGVLGLGYFGALALGNALATGVSLHPPLQLLPLFIGQLFFGLSAFAFRIPAILAVTGTAFGVYRLVSAYGDSKALWWRLFPAVASCFIPIVVYVGDAVEPSVYGYAAAVGALLLCWRFIRERSSELLIGAGVLVGTLALARHTALVWWAPIGVLYLSSAGPFDVKRALRTFFPSLFVLPYLRNAAILGHGAVQGTEGSLLDRLILALTSGTGVMSIINSLTVPWAVVMCLAIVLACLRASWRESLLFLSAIPAFVLFHAIWPYLWGLGRYQAEYVAPFLVYALVLVSIYSVSMLFQRLAVLCVAPVLVGTLQTMSLVPLDTRYALWPQMRISTSAVFPYDQAFRYLKRREAHGDFILLGGSPWYWDIFLWFAGMTFDDVRGWHSRQEPFMARLDTITDREQLATVAQELGVRYLVVQSGTRREMQHRPPNVQRIVDLLEAVPLKQRVPFYRSAQFHASGGGDIEVYRLKAP